MTPHKLLFAALCLVLVIAAAVGPCAAAPRTDFAGNHDNSSVPQLAGAGTRSGEVEVPVIRTTRPTQVPTPVVVRQSSDEETQRTPVTTPTIIPTTIRPTPSPSPQQGTPAPTQPTPAPVVTVYVYPYGPSYYPANYYPPGYPYPFGYSNSYGYYNSPGSLTVTSRPSNAVIIIDGYTTQTTPYVFTNVMPGYHTIEIDYPGYEAYVTSVYVDYGASPEIDANLVPLTSQGSLFVDSVPEGADVYVDGNYEGTSAVTVSGLSAGPHQVELHLAGYEVYTRTVNVIAGQGTNINPALISDSSSSSAGSIDIVSDQPGALVYLDGVYKGATQSSSIFNIIAVSPGTHTVLLHIPGYMDFTRDVQVNGGTIAHVTATFTPTPASRQSLPSLPGQAGSIIATSVPSGGQVYLDDKFRGVAPVTIYNVETGSHIVNMKLNSYSDWSSSVQVNSGQVVQVTATLLQDGVPASTRAGLPSALPLICLGIGILVLSFTRRK
jgi:hypothetical protein